ncbi:hypothetical protein LJC45_03090 [Alistipes sp. OttesenSCG-928-B03]|nr:hypothetical protein [Alistipes sp. OttesenSCG-928-B03]
MALMKKTILFLCCCAMLSACYEDKGNYDYSIVPEGVFEEIPDKYAVLRHDYVKINPVVSTINGEDEYDYEWALYDGNKMVEVIGEEKDLNYQMTKVGKDSYSIVFKAVSRTTGVPYCKALKLEIVTTWLWGWYVLKNIDGKTDLDYYTIPEVMEGLDEMFVHNLLGSSTGRQMEGEAKRICYTKSYREFDSASGHYQEATRLLLVSSDEVLVYNSSDGIVSRYTEDVFYSAPEVKNFSKAFYSFMDIYLLNDGKLYKLKGDMYNVGRFGNYVFTPGGALTDYTLSDYVAGAAMQPVIVFDEISRSFFTIGYTEREFTACRNNPELPKYQLSDMDYDLVYMRPHSVLGTASALMKHRTKKEYIMLELKLRPKSSSTPEPHLVGVREIDPAHSVTKAKAYAANFRIPYTYYASDTEVRITDRTGLTEKLLWTAPAGETITGIKFDIDHKSHYTLLIYTQNGDDYTVYIYWVDASNDGTFVGDQPEAVLRGTGQVADVKNTAISAEDGNDF